MSDDFQDLTPQPIPRTMRTTGPIILDDADHPAVEGGTYVIAYGELVDGYRHAFYDEDKRRVRYARSVIHPADDRCPECAEAGGDDHA